MLASELYQCKTFIFTSPNQTFIFRLFILQEITDFTSTSVLAWLKQNGKGVPFYFFIYFCQLMIKNITSSVLRIKTISLSFTTLTSRGQVARDSQLLFNLFLNLVTLN